MSMRPKGPGQIPAETVRVARAAFPKGSLAIRVRDELGVLFRDEEFADLFPARRNFTPWKRSHADDNQGDVIPATAGDAQVGQQRIGELFNRERAVLGEGVGQPRQAGVDVFTAAFDEAVGIEHEGVARV